VGKRPTALSWPCCDAACRAKPRRGQDIVLRMQSQKSLSLSAQYTYMFTVSLRMYTGPSSHSVLRLNLKLPVIGHWQNFRKVRFRSVALDFTSSACCYQQRDLHVLYSLFRRHGFDLYLECRAGLSNRIPETLNPHSLSRSTVFYIQP